MVRTEEGGPTGDASRRAGGSGGLAVSGPAGTRALPRWCLLAACAAAFLLLDLTGLAGGAPARAGEAPRLGDEVTDEVGALEGGEDELASRLRDIRDAGGVHLFALYTDTTGASTVTDFAEEVAAASSLGGDDALLVVALDDRTYALWVSDALAGVTDTDIDRVLVEEVEPRLVDGDFAAAAEAAAEGLATAAAGEPATGEPGGGSGLLPLLLVLGGLALIGTLAVRWVRERRGRRREAEERDRRLGELARRANTLLLAGDEAVREATQELGFAEARFRPVDVGPFRQALARARDELHAAFALRQRLDDGEPESPDERERLLRGIVEHAERLDTLLTAEHARLDELRAVERDAPALLAALPGEIATVERRAGEAEAALERLHGTAARSAAAVDGNLVEAHKRVRAAREAAARGEGALGQAEASTAAGAVRDAQEALAGAGELVGAVERLAAAAADAERDLEAELRAAAADVDAAAGAIASGRVQGLDAPMAEARSLLEQARTEAASGERDVLEAYRLAARADAAADEVLASVREASEQRARERAAAVRALRAAEAAYTRAADYLEARRRGIGREARTRLQEAERHLDRARTLVPAAAPSPASAPGTPPAGDVPDPGADPEAAREATREARHAERLAGEAYRLAQRDFSAYDRYQGPFGRGPFGGGWGRGRTVVIGGFPVPIGGSGRGGGGWGGSTWGSPGGGRARGGGFGGRVGGGGFGGGRARGGRF